ncbi:MAG: D-alanine--D-alanine ligase [Alphaproteobacteria bacterium]|jgi:D-alanine-D-alanine ligase|nr:D-alanine--D-alanine ligase [Alphaproteobacteria bacterium]MDP6517318.1 D-alanine--D-alanine ligase [Alphaproteobacteria bacterium]|tara:strand:- start:72 stop:986 length:915 start_codon:yes stop_codon:yes gene_type:complete
MTKRVAVLMGGWSAEREISLISGAAVCGALRTLGQHATPIDVAHDVAAKMAEVRPYTDVAFMALHGRYGEDGCVQGLCELMRLPYTHSGVLASALAMDKPMAKRLFADAGIPVPDGGVFHRDQVLGRDPMPRPYVIKPLNEGSSVGVNIVRPGDPTPFADEPWHYGDQVLVEPFVPGREITVAVMGERALGALEIRPKDDFYDYDAKYIEGRSEHLMPAQMPPKDYEQALEIALAAHRTLGCRGVSRADLRYDDSPGGQGLRLLEINTQPGLTPMSLVPEIAAHAGIDFPALIDWMVEDARCSD